MRNIALAEAHHSQKTADPPPVTGSVIFLVQAYSFVPVNDVTYLTQKVMNETCGAVQDQPNLVTLRLLAFEQQMH